MPFHPQSDLVETHGALRCLVDTVLGGLASGLLPSEAERQQVDIKEEAGRRGAGGVLLPGIAENLAAALIVGVEDRTGHLLGTALDPEWLRHRIYERVEIAPGV